MEKVRLLSLTNKTVTMKASIFIIRVPEPCHEDWNQMQPDVKGKFCMSCNKSVVDFSDKTDMEIRDILLDHKGEKVCGHFRKTQINRPLNISVNLQDLPRNISVTRAFAIALFIVFGTFLFSCTNVQGQKVETIEVIRPAEPESYWTMGEPMIPPDFMKVDSVFGKENMNEETCTAVAGEVYVDGGMELVEIPEAFIEQVSNDSALKEAPLIDHAVLGGVDYSDYFISEETTEADSSFLNNSRMEKANIINKSNNLRVYPNPSNGEFTVMYEVTKRADVSLVIYDLNGVLLRSLVNVHAQYEGNYQIPVNLKDLPNGIYIVSLINGDKKSTERLVIER